MAAIFHGLLYTIEDLVICAPVGTSEMKKVWETIRTLDPRARFRPDKMPMSQELVESPLMNERRKQGELF